MMFKKSERFSFLFGFIAVINIACDDDAYHNNKQEIKSGKDQYVQNATVCDPGKVDWVFMVYLNTDDEKLYGYADLEEIRRAGSTDRVKIVVLFDPEDQTNGDHPRLIEINKDTEDKVLSSWDELDMSDWKTLAEFGTRIIRDYPACHYALVIYGHGWGPFSFSPDDHPRSNGISVTDGEYASAMNAIVQTLGHKLDIIGFNSCLMGMWEIAVSSAPYADILVASEATMLSAGWPYDDILISLSNNPQILPTELAERIVNLCQANSPITTMAATDLSTVGTLTRAIDGLANTLIASKSSHSIVDQARAQSPSFFRNTAWSYHRDLGRFAHHLNNLPGMVSEVKAAATEVQTHLKQSIIANFSKTSVQEATGLSIYLPDFYNDFVVLDEYKKGIWSDQSRWDEFLSSYMDNNCRGKTYSGGECKFSEYTSCQNNQVTTVDCKQQGMICRVDHYKKIFGCVEDECGDIPVGGRCNDDVIETCVNNTRHIIDCAAWQEDVCVKNENNEYVCIDHECVDMPEEGRCVGNVLQMCWNGRLEVYDCSEYGDAVTCKWDEEENLYECY